MKTKFYKKVLLLLLIIPLFSFSRNTPIPKEKYSKTKTINKSFTALPNTTLAVENSYGNLDVVTWDENRIVFEITITTTSNDEEKAAEKLQEIDVDFQNTTDMVLAKTIFNKTKKSSWWKWNSNHNVNMEVNYVIKMPITNQVNLKNNYGVITLDNLKGSAILNCDYGKIITKSLFASHNSISFDYSDNCFFEYIESGIIKADYSDFIVEKTKNLKIEADYTKSKIEIAENIEYNCDYGGIYVDQVNHIKGNGDYLTTKIGKVYNSLAIDSDYGTIRIEELMPKVKNTIINADYTGIKIGYNPNYHFNFDIDLDYASLKGKESLEIIKQTTKNTSSKCSGYYGSSQSNNNLVITSDYGSVTLQVN